MEVDQEGDGGQVPGDDHGTEQENLDFGNQHQYDDAPSGGWNHETVSLTQTKEGPTIDLVADYDIREDMVRLGLRIYEAVVEASAKDEVPKGYRLYDLLNRVMKVMEAGQANQ
eukprot:14955177-Heterocapsa_arctica.AAC.1